MTNPAAAEEGPGGGDPVPGVFNFHRVGNLAVPVTVYLGFAGAAQKDVDFTGVLFSFNIPANQGDTTLNVLPIWDTLIEGDESVTVFLAPGFSYLVDENQDNGTMTIADAPQPTVSVAATDPTAAEDAGNGGADPGTWTISRTGGTTQPLTVVYQVSRTAQTNDYTTNPGLATSGTITIPAQASSVTIQLNPEWNLELEPLESVTLEIMDTDDYVAAAGLPPAVITIDDAPLPLITVSASDPDAYEEAGMNWDPESGTYTITRSGNLSQPLTVRVSFSGSASSGTDYTLNPATTTSVTIPANQASVTLTLTPTQDEDYSEGTETRKLTLERQSNDPYQLGQTIEATVTIHDAVKPTVTIAAADPIAREETATGAVETGLFLVSRSGSLAHDVTVNYQALGSSTATSGTDYATLSGSITIFAGSTSAYITLTPQQDNLNSEGDETVILRLLNGANYTTDESVSATVTIADSPLPRVSVATSDSQAAEPVNGIPDVGTFTVTRQGRLNQSLEVELVLSGSALVQSDYTSTPGASSDTVTVTFAAGQTSKTITLTPQTDTNYQEGSEQATISIQPSPNHTTQGSTQATVTIADAPGSPIIEIVASTPDTTEPLEMMPGYPMPANPAVATVSRIGQLEQELTVQINVSGSASSTNDYTALPGVSTGVITVTFLPYETHKTISFTALDDTLKDADETVVLTVAASQSSSYLSGEDDEATLIIHDNHPVITVEATDALASEPYGMMPENGEFTIRRTGGNLWQEVNVSYTLTGSADDGTDYSAYSNFSYSPGSITIPAWASEVTVIVQPWGDSLEEGIETVVLTLNDNSWAYIAGQPSSDRVFIGDASAVDSVIMASDPDATKTNALLASDPGQFKIVRLGGNPNTQESVSFTISGSADWGDDYTLNPSSSVTFLPYEGQHFIDVWPYAEDPSAGGDETVVVTLNSPYDYTAGGALNQATVTLHAAPNTPPQLINPPNGMQVFGGPPTEVLEDSSLLVIPFRADDQETPAFDLNVTATAEPAGIINLSVVLPAGAAGSERELHITPIPNQFGEVTVTATDAVGGQTGTTSKTLVVKVLPVNDMPTFTKGADITVDAGAPRKTIPAWATIISKGPANENSQAVTFLIDGYTEDGLMPLSDLFLELPTNSSNGTLTFKPAADKFGTAVIIAKIKDDGGTANNGQDTSPPQYFLIKVNGNSFHLPDEIFEMDTATGTGTATGTPGMNGDIEVNWGDGSPVEVAYSGVFGEDGKMSFAIFHQFRDDNPTNTPQDQHQVTVRVEERFSTAEPGSGTTTYTFPPEAIVVKNRVPTQDLSLQRQVQGHLYELSGSITDASPDDQFMMHIDWGDGTIEDAQVDPFLLGLPAKVPFYGHTYVPGDYLTFEDGRGYANVTITTKDDDGGTIPQQTFRVEVDDAPIDQHSGPNRSYNALAGTNLTVSAVNGLLKDWFDPDFDSITASIGSQPAHGTISVNSNGSFVYTSTESDFTGTESFTYEVSDGWTSATATVTIKVYSIHLHAVDFAGAGLIPINSDPDPGSGATEVYSGADWLDEDDDPSTLPDQQFPVAYVSGSTIAVSPEFTVGDGSGEAVGQFPAGFLVRASGPDGMTISPIDIALAADSNCLFNSPLVEHLIKYYPQFDIQWEVSPDGGANWKNIGTSSNRLYSTYSPRTGNAPVYETVIHLSTTNANGHITRSDIASAIYNDFTDLSVKRMDGEVLLYWGPFSTANSTDPICNTVSNLLKEGDGNCAAFANLFEAMLDVQGLGDSARVVEILPTSNPTNTKNPDYRLLLRAWGFNPNGGSFPDAADGFTHKFPTSSDTSDLSYPPAGPDGTTDTSGPSGQGGSPAPAIFANHYLVHWNDIVDGVTTSVYFDPSYGISANSLIDWQAIALVGTTKRNGSGVLVAKPIGSPLPENPNEQTLDVKAINDF